MPDKPDICVRCLRQTDRLQQVQVPGKNGSTRTWCLTCCLGLTGGRFRRLSPTDRARVFNWGVHIHLSGRRKLGLSPRDFPRRVKP